ncbi:MAG: response regulator [bacterium]
MTNYLRTTIENIQKNLECEKDNIKKYLYTQRLASLGHLVGDIAHKFNNILGGILGYSQLLQNEIEPTSDAYRHALVIEKAAKRATKLISQLRLFINSHVYEKKPVCPEKLVKEVVTILESTFNKNIKINIQFNHSNEKILADFSAMCQALVNVCLNARDAMPDGGTLVIQTAISREKGRVQYSTKKNLSKKYVVFKIKDSGVGIAKKNLPLIFEPFFTTKDLEIGSGLGLTIVEGIVKDHRGKIKVYSKIGEGTTFEIYLPTTIKTCNYPEMPAFVEDELGEGELIMVVDDEEVILNMAKNIFEKKGYKVLLADNGESAIKIYNEHADEIKLIILDMILPDIGGACVCQKIKAKGFKSKIILTSGYTNKSTINNMFKQGVESFVPKPWDLPELLKETKRVLKSN